MKVLARGILASALVLVSFAVHAQCTWGGSSTLGTLCPVGVGVSVPATQFHVTNGGGDLWSMFQRGAQTDNIGIFFRTGTNSATDWIIGQKASNEHLVFSHGGITNSLATLETDGDLALGTNSGYGRLHVHETRAVNHQLILSNAGTYHTGFIATLNPAAVFTDTAAWGLFGGPNVYLSGAANRVVMPLAEQVPGFFVTRHTNLNTPPLGYVLTVLRSGAVGINTATPGTGANRPANTVLDVVGNVYVQGELVGESVRANYQDVAEWVVGEGELAPGTVVIVAPDRRDVVTASTEAYDTRVAGVVSPAPGVLLGLPGESKVMVATTGRVKVKVDATAHAIKAGDVLVTSAKSGMAMKSEPMEIGGRRFHQPGTIVGKALEPLEKGTGEILVLLSLQ